MGMDRAFVDRCKELGLHPNRLTSEQRGRIIAELSRGELRRKPLTAAQMTRETARQMSLMEKAKAALKIMGAAKRVILNPLPDAAVELRHTGCLGCNLNVSLIDQDVACSGCGCARGFKIFKLRDPKAKCPHPKGSRWPV